MNPAFLEDIYKGWTSINIDQEDGDTETNLLSKHEELNRVALEWALKKGGPPKVIKRLAPQELHDPLLRKARSNFIIIHGKKCAFEEAIKRDNLNFIKAIFTQTEDRSFATTAFVLAVLYRKNKTAEYISKNIPDLIDQETIQLVFEYITKIIAEKSLRSLKIFFNCMQNQRVNLIHYDQIIVHGTKQCAESSFEKGALFFEAQGKIKNHSSDLMINTI